MFCYTVFVKQNIVTLLEGYMLISKKDLLEKTGISYGQLYRWKREGLIPDEWFQKQSSFTGQETFFEETLILDRVEMILKLKDTYSLDEIREMIEKEPHQRQMNTELVKALEEIENQVRELYEKEEYTYFELALLSILSKLYREYGKSIMQLKGLLHGICPFFTEHAAIGKKLVVYEINQNLIGLYVGENTVCEMDIRAKRITEFKIDFIIKEIKDK